MSPRLRWCCAFVVIGALFPVSSFAQTAAPPADAPPAEPPAAAEAAPPPAPPPPAPSAPSLKIESANASLKIGLLAQAQYESLGNRTYNGTANNLFLRRARILLGGSFLTSFDYFVETDSANLFKSVDTFNAGMPAATPPVAATAETTKTLPAMSLQDVILTYKPLAGDKELVDAVKVDVGYMLPSLAHNSLQGAGTLYGFDFFAYTFQHSNSFGANGVAGRDLGAQLRGLLLGGHVEYRVGMFQGVRNSARPTDTTTTPATVGEVGGRNFFRVAARVQVNLLDAEPGFFYAGTYLGKKRILSLGASYDFQGTYKYYGLDGFLDMPVGPGVVTAQVNYAQWDPGSTPLVNVAKQHAIMSEGGFKLAGIPVAIIARFEQDTIAATATAAAITESRYGGGLALFAFGHTSNLKAFFMKVHEGSAAFHDYNQGVVQWQVYFF
jgi:hypothetical protein